MEIESCSLVPCSLQFRNETSLICGNHFFHFAPRGRAIFMLNTYNAANNFVKLLPVFARYFYSGFLEDLLKMPEVTCHMFNLKKRECTFEIYGFFFFRLAVLSALKTA